MVLRVVLFAVVVLGWIAFGVLLVVDPLILAEVWLWFGNLPVVARAVVGLVGLPWVLGLAAWFSPFAEGLRYALVALIALVSIAVFFPRRPRREPGAGSLADAEAIDGERLDEPASGAVTVLGDTAEEEPRGVSGTSASLGPGAVPVDDDGPPTDRGGSSAPLFGDDGPPSDATPGPRRDPGAPPA